MIRLRFILTSSTSTEYFLFVVLVRLLMAFTLDDVTSEALQGLLEAVKRLVLNN